MIPYYTIPLLFLQAMPSLIKNILPGFLIFCVFLTNHATAQNTNPFELEERIDSVLSANSKSETIKTDVKVLEDTTSQPPEKQEDLILNQNPFEVSHIPLRSSQLEEEENIVMEHETSKNNSFPFWLILFSCALLAIVISLKRSLLAKLRRSILNDNTMKALYREEKGGNSFVFMTLYFMFFINTALFISMAMAYFGIDKIPVFLMIMLGIILVYVIRHFSLYIMGLGFPVKKESSKFNFAIKLYNIIIGILLIPINLILAYGPETMIAPFVYLGLTSFIIMYILRQLRGLFISFRFINLYKFHFFIYLCACEIAPLFILVKILFK